MSVIPNNCVSEIKFPKTMERADGFDYNPALDFFATFDYSYGASVWDPSTGRVFARIEELGENFRDVLFLPGNHLAVSSSEAHHGGSINIFSLEEGRPVSLLFEIDSKDLPVDYPGAIALSPGGNLLVSEAFNGGGIHEVFIDWGYYKVLKTREVIPSTEESAEDQILRLCCSQNFDVAWFDFACDAISEVTVTGFSTEGEAQIQKQEKITYYVLEGEDKRIASTDNFFPEIVHDGQNLIIATENEIVLLESATEGSNAHLIASDCKPSGNLRINHEGQLMVCKENKIKLYEYKSEVKSLQSLCRCNVRETIRSNFIGKEHISVIPSSMQNDDGNADCGNDDDDDDDDDDDNDGDDSDIKEPIPTYYAEVVHNLAIPSLLKDYLLHRSV